MRLDDSDIPLESYALRPVRVDERNDRFVFYEAVTFPSASEGRRATCAMYLRRAQVCGRLNLDSSNYQIEILDENGDPIKEFPVERGAFRYLIEKLKLKVIREKDHTNKTGEN